MSHEEAFLQTICDHPDDDSPRLIFADFLDEHGQSDRAEFIRLQCERAGLTEWEPRSWQIAKREDALLKKHWAAWVKSLRGLVPASQSRLLEFQRGFVNSINLQVKTLLRGEEELFRIHPIQLLRLEPWDGTLHFLCGCPFLDRISDLSLRDDSCDAETLRGFLNSSPFTRLRGLGLRGGPTPRTAFLEALVIAPVLKRLERLELWFTSNEEVRLVTGTRALNCLQELTVRFGALDKLTVLRDLVSCSHLRDLTVLDLGYLQLGEGAGQILAASPHLRNLTRLILTENALKAVDVIALAESRYLGRLEVLALDGNQFHPRGVHALAASPQMARLKRLELASAPIRDEGARALATSPHLANLCQLMLHNCGITDAGITALARSAFLTQLVWLSLSGNPIGDKGALALVKAPHLAANLAHLSLSQAPLSHKTRRTLRQVFGERLRWF